MERLNNNELRALPFDQLQMKLHELRRDLLELRLKSATTHVKTFSSDQKVLRRSIARVLTHIEQKHAVSFETSARNG